MYFSAEFQVYPLMIRYQYRCIVQMGAFINFEIMGNCVEISIFMKGK